MGPWEGKWEKKGYGSGQGEKKTNPAILLSTGGEGLRCLKASGLPSRGLGRRQTEKRGRSDIAAAVCKRKVTRLGLSTVQCESGGCVLGAEQDLCYGGREGRMRNGNKASGL